MSSEWWTALFTHLVTADNTTVYRVERVVRFAQACLVIVGDPTFESALLHLLMLTSSAVC